MEKTKKKSLDSDQRKFVARAVAWATFACVLPVAFIGWRYDLFKKVGSLQLSGWGMIGVAIVFAFGLALVKYVKAGFSEWSMAKQILSGIAKVLLPLGALLALCVGIRDSLDYFIQAIGCVLMCEAVAIPLNPFPKWVYEKTQGRFESAVDFVASRLQKKEDDK